MQCKYMRFGGKCNNGDNCSFAHSSAEQVPLLGSCKSWSLCINFAKDACLAGDNCMYVHDKSNLNKFKTAMCRRFLQYGYCDRGMYCSYAHHSRELVTLATEWTDF